MPSAVESLAFDYSNDMLWAGGRNGLMWKVDPDTLSISNTISFEEESVWSLAHDGTYLWVGYNGFPAIIQINPTEPEVVARYPYPTDRTVYDFTYVNNALWLEADEKILETDLEGALASDPPTASFEVSPPNPTPGTEIAFDASISEDPNGTITSYEWSFSGGGPVDETEKVVSHTYSSGGNYEVVLRVTDEDWVSDTTYTTVSVGEVTDASQIASTITLPQRGARGLGSNELKSGDNFITSHPRDPAIGDSESYEIDKSGSVLDKQIFNVLVNGICTGEDSVFAGGQISGGEPRLHKYLVSGEVRREAMPSRVESLTFDHSDAMLWGGTADGKILKINPNSLAIIRTIDASSGAITSLAHDGTFLWIGVRNYPKIIQYNPSDNVVVAEYEYSTTETVHDFMYLDDVLWLETDYKLLKTNLTADGSNKSPTASFDVSPSDPTVGTTVTFDASGATDPDGTIDSYEWDLTGDGTTDDRGKTISYTYSSSGDYNVSLTITDDDGATDTITTTVTVAATETNTPPQPSFTFSPENPEVGTSVTFDGSDSIDPDGSIVSYEWDFTADGTIDDTGETVSYTYSSSGEYDVALVVTDDDGVSESVLNTVLVDESDPLPSGVVSEIGLPETSARGFGVVDDEFESFVTSHINDPPQIYYISKDGSVTDSFEADTPYLAVGISNEAVYAGNSGLTKFPFEDGAESTDVAMPADVFTVAVSDTEDVLWAGGSNGEIWRVDPVSLEITRTIDFGGEIFALAWDSTHLWVGDLNESVILRYNPSTDERVATYEYPDVSAVYGFTFTEGTLWLEVDETLYETSTDQLLSNNLPSASFSTSPRNPTAGTTVTFDASTSEDPDGSIESYEWDLNSDGTFELNGRTTDYTFEDAGEYEVTLRVTDSLGGTATTTQLIEIDPGITPPEASFSIDPEDPTAGSIVMLDASASSDPDGVIESYEWDIDGDGEFERFGETIEVTVGSPGQYEVTLRVIASSGSTDMTTQVIEIDPSITPPEASFSIEPANPTVESPIMFDASDSSDPDGVIESYEWDLDGDGTVERSDQTVEYTYESAGAYEVTLRVTDASNSTDATTQTVEVTQPTEFDPVTHGFGFPNWGGKRGCEIRTAPEAECPQDRQFEIETESIDVETVRNNITDWDTSVQGARLELLARVIYLMLVRQTASNGHCYGMVFTAEEYFTNPSRLPDGVASASEIPRPTGAYASVGETIRNYHVSQRLNAEVFWLTMFEFQFGAIDYQAALDELTTAIDENVVAGMALGDSDSSGGHQVLAYDYEEVAGEVKIFIYDPKFPASSFDNSYAISIDAETGKIRTDYFVYDQYSHLDPTAGIEAHDALTSTPRELLSQFEQAAAFMLNSPASLEITAPEEATVIHPSSENEYTGVVRDAAFVVGALPGEYEVNVVGEGNGEYTIETLAVSNDEVVIDETASGTISEDETHSYMTTLPETSETNGEFKRTSEDQQTEPGNGQTDTESGVETSAPSETPDETEDSTRTETEHEEIDTDTPSQETPGFGIGTALAGLGSAAYMIKRRLHFEDEEE